MSNEEEAKMLDEIQNGSLGSSTNEQINRLDRLFIPKGDNEPKIDKTHAQNAQNAQNTAPVTEHKAPVPPEPKKAAKTVITDKVIKTQVEIDAEEKLNTQKRIADLENIIVKLIAGVNPGISLAQEPPRSHKRKGLDWSKMSEKDIYDLSVPIEARDNSIPDYIVVKLKDSTKVPRYVHKASRRLGPMKSMGYQFVRPEDLETELPLGIEVNAQGQLQFDDVILMMIDKSIYYSMMRTNHVRALAQTDPIKAHQTARSRVETDLMNAEPEAGNNADRTRPNDYSNYHRTNKLDIYAPGVEI